MNDDELGRLLSGAFEAEAGNAVGDDRVPPPARFESPVQTPAAQAELPGIERVPGGEVLLRTGTHRRAESERRAWLARAALPLSAAAAVVVLVGLVLALVGHGTGSSRPTHTAAALRTSHSAPVHHTHVVTSAHRKSVHIKLLNADGSRVGVGMPVIAYFSKKITDARALQSATSVTVDGKSMTADWYFEPSLAYKSYPYEAHLRPKHYWPAHSSIHVAIATSGLSAGKGLHFDDSLTLDFDTAASHIVTVNDRTHMLTVVSDGTTLFSDPVSLGAANTPTRRGVKVVMEKGASICMTGPGYHKCGVKYTQRLTYDGEYLHAAGWNVPNIKAGINTSNGGTDLLPRDAQRLYGLLRIGDVVKYPNANGPLMQVGSGYGDWNVPWSQWRTGGIVPTR